MASNTENIILIAENRKAAHEYYLLERYEAGIVLSGTEIKSIRNKKANLNEAFCYAIDGELFVRNMHVSEYTYGTYNNHETKRLRKLLLKRSELRKIDKKIREKGFAVVPTRLYITERGFAKLEIALARGKKEYDKRDSIKEKDNKREADRRLHFD